MVSASQMHEMHMQERVAEAPRSVWGQTFNAPMSSYQENDAERRKRILKELRELHRAYGHHSNVDQDPQPYTVDREIMRRGLPNHTATCAAMPRTPSLAPGPNPFVVV